MEKINFENLPSTNTPINANNLNQLQTNVENEFTKKASVMTIGLSNDMTFSKANTGSTSNLITMDKVMSSSGNKLTFDSTNHAIKIGAGVSKVKVSANAIQSANGEGLSGINIHKNDMSLNGAVNVGFNAIKHADQWIRLGLAPVLIDVSEGDLIKLSGYVDINSLTITMKAYNGRATNLTVEVVE